MERRPAWLRRDAESFVPQPYEQLAAVYRREGNDHAARPFRVHEVLEAAWKAAPERELWRGLAQLAVGLTHARRGNPAGAARLAAYRDAPPHGVDVAGLVAFAEAGADGVPRLRT